MNFSKLGLDGLTPGSDYYELFFKLDPVEEMESFGHENARGRHKLNDREYVIAIVKSSTSDQTDLVELSGFYGGDTFEGIAIDEVSVHDFMGELKRIGSDPIYVNSMIFWPEEKISFYVYKGSPRTIGWWSTGVSTDHAALEDFYEYLVEQP